MPRKPAPSRPASRASARTAEPVHAGSAPSEGASSAARATRVRREEAVDTAITAAFSVGEPAASPPKASKRKATKTPAATPPAKRGSAKRAAAPTKTKAGKTAGKPRKRTRSAQAAGDDLEHGFVPKALPPGAAAPGAVAPRSRETVVPESSVHPEQHPARIDRPASSGAAEPTARPYAAQTAVGSGSPSAHASSRIRCQSCDYPLPRTAKFCRRCGIRQVPLEATSQGEHAARSSPKSLPTAPVRPAAVPPEPQNPAHPGPAHPGPAHASPAAARTTLDRNVAATHWVSPAMDPTGRIRCPACDMRLPSSARFCRGCGVLLVGASGTQPPVNLARSRQSDTVEESPPPGRPVEVATPPRPPEPLPQDLSLAEAQALAAAAGDPAHDKTDAATSAAAPERNAADNRRAHGEPGSGVAGQDESKATSPQAIGHDATDPSDIPAEPARLAAGPASGTADRADVAIECDSGTADRADVAAESESETANQADVAIESATSDTGPTGTATISPSDMAPHAGQSSAPQPFQRPLASSIVRTCRECEETIPAIARYCLYCGCAQSDLASRIVKAPAEPLPTALSAPTGHGADGTASGNAVGAESGALSEGEPAALASASTEADAQSPDAVAHPSSESTHQPPAEHEPRPEPEPEPDPIPSLLADDVLERVGRAQHDIDTIGKDLERLSRRALTVPPSLLRPGP